MTVPLRGCEFSEELGSFVETDEQAGKAIKVISRGKKRFIGMSVTGSGALEKSNCLCDAAAKSC